MHVINHMVGGKNMATIGHKAQLRVLAKNVPTWHSTTYAYVRCFLNVFWMLFGSNLGPSSEGPLGAKCCNVCYIYGSTTRSQITETEN